MQKNSIISNMHLLETSLNESLAFSSIISGFLQFLQRAPWLFKPVYHQLSVLYTTSYGYMTLTKSMTLKFMMSTLT